MRLGRARRADIVVLCMAACTTTTAANPTSPPDIENAGLDQACAARIDSVRAEAGPQYASVTMRRDAWCPPQSVGSLARGCTAPPTTGSRDADGTILLPDLVLRQFFSKDDTFAACESTFFDPEDSTLIMLTTGEGGLAEQRHEMRQYVLSALNDAASQWTFCDNAERRGILDVHGEYNLDAQSIVLYSTACDEVKIYGQQFHLDAAGRYYLVAAHEFGHFLDHRAGRLGRLGVTGRENAEKRATHIGLFLVECLYRTMASRLDRILHRSYTADGDSYADLHCMHQYVRYMAEHVRTLRRAWGINGAAAMAGIEWVENTIACANVASSK